jgi:hypothetical protein
MNCACADTDWWHQSLTSVYDRPGAGYKILFAGTPQLEEVKDNYDQNNDFSLLLLKVIAPGCCLSLSLPLLECSLLSLVTVAIAISHP